MFRFLFSLKLNWHRSVTSTQQKQSVLRWRFSSFPSVNCSIWLLSDRHLLFVCLFVCSFAAPTRPRTKTNTLISDSKCSLFCLSRQWPIKQLLSPREMQIRTRREAGRTRDNVGSVLVGEKRRKNHHARKINTGRRRRRRCCLGFGSVLRRRRVTRLSRRGWRGWRFYLSFLDAAGAFFRGARILQYALRFCSTVACK